jgi:surface protein
MRSSASASIFLELKNWRAPAEVIPERSSQSSPANMFNGASAFNGDISSWNTASATSIALHAGAPEAPPAAAAREGQAKDRSRANRTNFNEDAQVSSELESAAAMVVNLELLESMVLVTMRPMAEASSSLSGPGSELEIRSQVRASLR